MWPVAYGDGVSDFSHHWWNWHTVKSYWRALIFVAVKEIGGRRSCQTHTRPGNVFFSRNMERPLLRKGVGRQTSGHFRGGKFDPFVLLSLSTSNFTDLPSAGFQRRERGEEKTLDWSASANVWVTRDGSQGGSFDNSLSSWWEIRYCHTQHHRCT